MKKATKHIITAIVVIAFLVISTATDEEDSSQSDTKEVAENLTIEGTIDCLIGKWRSSNSSFKNSSYTEYYQDGTFYYYTSMFDGMWRKGNWSVHTPGKVIETSTQISEYDLSIPDPTTMNMIECGKMRYGKNVIVRE